MTRPILSLILVAAAAAVCAAVVAAWLFSPSPFYL